MADLNNISPKFRNLVDLLFFSNKNIDVDVFKTLFKENYHVNFKYLTDTFSKSKHIFWEDGHELWRSRFVAIFSLNDKNVSNYFENVIINDFLYTLRSKQKDDLCLKNEFFLFCQWCNVKRNDFSIVPSMDLNNCILLISIYMKKDLVTDVVKSFVPYTHSSYEEMGEFLTRNLKSYPLNILPISEFIGQGYIKSDLLYNVVSNLLKTQNITKQSSTLFFTLLNNSDVKQHLVSTDYEKSDFYDYFKYATNLDLEKGHFQLFKNVNDIDKEMVKELFSIYIHKVYERNTYKRNSNFNKIIKTLKTLDFLDPRIFLSFLIEYDLRKELSDLYNIYPDFGRIILYL